MGLIRFVLRSLWWAVLGIGLPLALLLAAWLPFNIGITDAAPRAPAPALAVPPKQLPDERNAAFALTGLMAEAGREPQATGRAWWANLVAQAALPAPLRAATDAAAQAKRNDLLGKAIKAPDGAPLHCKTGSESCTEEWFAQTEALARQREAYGVLGERCDKYFGVPFEFEEPLPPNLAPDTPLLGWAPLVHCSRWFRTGAVLALARGQKDKALEQLRRADRLHRTVWEGSRTLIGHVIAIRMAQLTYDTMAALALRDPALAEAMVPWLAGAPDTRPSARRWMQTEAALQRGLVDHIMRDGMAVPRIDGVPDVVTHFLGSGAAAAAMKAVELRNAGLQPERTKQRLDEAWLREMAKLQYPWAAVLAGAGVERQTQERRTIWSHLRWRNTFGEALVDAATAGKFQGYYARHADQELHREATALVLALQRQRTPAPGRAEAAKRLATSDTLKERMSWDASGRTLSVRTWRAETPAAGSNERRDAISFTWP